MISKRGTASEVTASPSPVPLSSLPAGTPVTETDVIVVGAGPGGSATAAHLAQAGADPRFQTSRDLGRFVLEGLARGAMTYDELARKERLLTVVKRAVRVLNRKGDVQELWPE